MKWYILFWNILFFNCSLFGQNVTTISGILGISGSSNGTNASYNNPHGVEVSPNGYIYIADRYNHLIRKISLDGSVSTLAGSGVSGKADGMGTNASFNEPWGLTADSLENVYVADTKNNKIRKITPDGTVTTLAGTGNFGVTDSNNPLAASFGNPTGIAIDKNGTLYIADHLTHIIRKITKSGVVSTLAGNKNYPNNFGLTDGIGQLAKFYRPYGLELDRNGNVYVADEWNHAIRKINSFGVVTTIAGNGTIGSDNGTTSTAKFNYPWDVTIDSVGNIYVADGLNYDIRKIAINGHVSVYAGKIGISGGADGFADNATFNGATSLSISKSNKYIIVGDAYNHLIRKIDILDSIAKPSIAYYPFNSSKDSLKICYNSDISLKIKGNFDNYNLYNDSNLITTFSDSIFSLKGLPTGVYNIKIGGTKTSYPELFSNVLNLKIDSIINFNIMSSPLKNNFCEGDSVLLKTSNHIKINWNNLIYADSIFAKKSGTYYALIDSNKCYGKQDTIRLVFNPKPTISLISSPNSPYTEGDSVWVKATGATSYTWNNGAITDSILITKDTLVYATGTSNLGCSNISEILKIEFKPKIKNLKIILIDGKNKFCAGKSVKISANIDEGIIWYKDYSPTTNKDSVLEINESGWYYFSYTPKNGTAYNSDTVFISEKTLPNVDFKASETLISTSNSTVIFTSMVDEKVTYSWNCEYPNQSNMITDSVVNYTYNQPGLYSINLKVKDIYGCENQLIKNEYIEYIEPFFIANAFTPNQDGINDKVVVHGISQNSKVDFKIYNEWGEIVFESTQTNASWDGFYKGSIANQGNYTYQLSYIQNNQHQTVSGIITLIK